MALDRAKRPSGQRKFAVFHDDGCHHVETLLWLERCADSSQQGSRKADRPDDTHFYSLSRLQPIANTMAFSQGLYPSAVGEHIRSAS